MKQTKPYGRAFKPSGSGISDPPLVPLLNADIPLPIPAEEDHASPAVDAGSQFAPPLETAGPISLPARVLVYAVSALVATAGYIWIRDSLFAQNLITMVTTKETVMICMSGSMQYDGWSLWERLAGNGYFVCTDWKVQTRFGSIPRF